MAADDLRVLLVEGDPHEAELFEQELHRAGFHPIVERVEDEGTFRRALGEFAPDVILADDSLPTFSSIQALQTANEERPDVPFLLVSRNPGDEQAAETSEHVPGPTDLVRRDRLEEIGPAVRRALGRAGVRPEWAHGGAHGRQPYFTLVEEVPVGFLTVDDQLRLTYVNSMAERLWGKPRQELLGKVVWDLLPRIPDPGVAEVVQEFLASGKSARFETCNDVGDRWFEVHAHRMETGYSASFFDVTDRRRAEEQRDAAEARYRGMIEQIPAVTYLVGARDEGFVYVSPQVESLVGYTVAEVMGDPSIMLRALHPDDGERVLRVVDAAKAQGIPYEAEYRLITKDGRTIWVHDRAAPVTAADGRPLMHGVVFDITERKSAEETVHHREAVLEAVAFVAQHLHREGSREAVVLEALARLGEAVGVDRVIVIEAEEATDGRIVVSASFEWAAPGLAHISPRVQRMDATAMGYGDQAAGLQKGEVIPRDVRDAPTPMREFLEELGAGSTLSTPLFSGDRWLGSLTLISSCGPRTWQASIVDAMTVAASALGAAIEEGRMRDALERSEREFRAVSENAPDVIIRVGTDLRYRHVNREMLRVVGRSREELVGRHVRELKLEEALAREWEEHLREAFETGQGFVFSAWWPTVRGPRFFESHGIIEQGPSGEVESVLIVARDLTERELAEQALRESEKRFRFLADNANDVVLRYRILPEPALEYVSPSVTTITGYSPEELYANPDFWTALAHPEDRHLLEPILSSPFDYSAPFTLRVVRKDATLTWLELQVVPIRDGQGNVEAIHAIARDVTERIRAEQQLRASLDALRAVDKERQVLVQRLVAAQEEERLRIANDIHDDSIQLMTAVGMRLAILRNELRDAQESGSIGKLEETVQEATARLRNLVFKLRPAALDREGIGPALREYIETSRREDDPEVTVHDRLEAEPSLETRVLIYRLAQEALTNVRKHAKAVHVEIDLALEHRRIHVRIRDDGVGFDPEALGESAPGHVGLISMRERAELVGGMFRVTSSPGAGTIVEFWIPEP
ncbi:MAG: PAS domain S-box protein [Actinomycetota bacterium]